MLKVLVPFYVMLLAWRQTNVCGLDICEDQEDAVRLAHPADCSRFIQCHRGETVAIRYCPFGLHFNRYESICDYKFRAGCDFSYATQLISYDNGNKLNCEACKAKCSSNGSIAGGSGSINPPGRPNAENPQDIPSSVGSKPATPCLTAPTPKPTAPTPTITRPTASTPCSTKPSTSPKPTAPTLTATQSTAPTPCPTKSSTPPKPTAPTPCPTKPSTPLAPTSSPTKPSTSPKPTASPTSPTKPPSGSEGGSAPSCARCADPGKCRGQRDGALFPDNSSNGFIVCQCQCEIKMPCPTGLVFNADLQVCDWPQS